MNVLVVEDQKDIASFIEKGLKEQGFAVEVSHNGDEAFALATMRPYDAIVLDIMLPGRDGLSILSNLRKRKMATPVILLTARAELDERIEGLNLGADDYLTKPFYVDELVARLHAVIRRASGDGVSMLRSGDLAVNLVTREAARNGQAIPLTTKEFNILTYLMRTPGRVTTRTQVLEHVWGFDFDPNTNLVDVHIQRLRTKLCPEDKSRFIETLRGVGYRFKKDGGA